MAHIVELPVNTVCELEIGKIMKTSRRSLLLSTGAVAASSLLPRRVMGSVVGANEKVNVAWGGVGNRGPRIIENFERAGIANFVAFCDVDPDNKNINATKEKFPQAKIFQDWRKMLDDMDKDIDAVVVLVPDHSHFPITMAAMAAKPSISEPARRPISAPLETP